MSTEYRLHQSLGYQLSLAARIQQRRLDDGLRPHGLSRTFWAVLVAVGLEGREQPSDIADFLGIDRTATSRALRRMEAAGLVARAVADGDGRARRVALTDRGRVILAASLPVARRNAAVMAQRLTQAEQAQLRRLLKKLTKGADARPTHL